MQKTGRIIVSVLFLLVVGNWLFVTPLNAQVPTPEIVCNDVSDQEFHLLRPYQASATCISSVSDYASFCGNNLSLVDTIEVNYLGGSNCRALGGKTTCDYSINVNKPITINLSGATLPIMGNTEEDLDNAEKTNQYVSWYLNGIKNSVDFGGPVNKLLPLDIQNQARIKSVKDAGTQRHNQIVIKDGKTYRLSSWDGDLILASAYNFLIDAYSKIYPDRIGDIVEESIGNVWKSKLPPIMGDPQFADNEKLYLKAYQEWKGKSCILFPITNFLFCVDNPLVSNEWADLFSNIPLSSTEDIKGNIIIDNVSSAANTSTNLTVKNVQFSNQNPSTLFFPHLIETDQLGSLLQDTYVPKGAEKIGDPADVDSRTCNSLEVRSNSGDNLFASQLSGNLSYDATFSCDFETKSFTSTPACKSVFGNSAVCAPTSATCGNRYAQMDCLDGYTCASGCTTSVTDSICKKDITINLTTQSNTPIINDIWSRLVAGPASVFKRIFPKTNTEGSVGQIIDIPGSTNVQYSGAQADSASLNLPHIGGISEYFLKGIQTALRPKGFGETITFNKSYSCGEKKLPDLPEATDLACKMKKPSNIPQIMVDILEAAAQAYNVPASVIYATFMHEGGDHYTWDDSNAMEWSLCGGEVLNCDRNGITAQPPYGWFPHYFYDFGYWDAVKVIDPGRTMDQTSPCNFLDATFATAKALSEWASGAPVSARFVPKQDPSQTFSKFPDKCLGFDLNNGSGSPRSCGAWNVNTVVTSQIGYAGWCPEPGKHPIQPYFPDIDFWIYSTVDYFNNLKYN